MARRRTALGVVVAAGLARATTALLFPLEEIAPPVSLGVLYLLAVLLVSTLWGLWLGPGDQRRRRAAPSTSSTSRRPAGSRSPRPRTGSRWRCSWSPPRSPRRCRTWPRARAREAEQRRREADLAAELARLLLGTPEPRAALAPARRSGSPTRSRSTRPRSCSSASRATSGTRRSRSATTARWSSRPRPRERRARARRARRWRRCWRRRSSASGSRARWWRRSALRRSDEIKTAVLRSVSHDLRSPLTAIVAAGEALSSPALDDEDRAELADAIAHESRAAHAPRRPAARPLAAAGRRRRAARGLDARSTR